MITQYVMLIHFAIEAGEEVADGDGILKGGELRRGKCTGGDTFYENGYVMGGG